ncbi:MAG: hypothetical protein ACTHOI_04195 [Sphingomicrobium sp.]
MTAYTSHIEEVRELRFSRDRIASLLGRYPHISDKERKDILEFMKEGKHLEIGLLTSNDKIRPQLDAFMDDHKRHFRIGPADVTRLVAVFAAVAMFCWLIWELVRPAHL